MFSQPIVYPAPGPCSLLSMTGSITEYVIHSQKIQSILATARTLTAIGCNRSYLSSFTELFGVLGNIARILGYPSVMNVRRFARVSTSPSLRRGIDALLT